MITYNLGWGNSVAVRKAFLQSYKGKSISFPPEELEKFDYPTHEGDEELIHITRDVVERQTGTNYKYILLTNGATGGVVISLRGFKELGFSQCITRDPPYYVRYPRMIKASGMEHVLQGNMVIPFDGADVTLTDFPSNPLGLTTPINTKYIFTSDTPPFHIPNILDGVYFNNVYMERPKFVPYHDVMVGSYSKLTGINGVRIGWIATNNDTLYEALKELVTSEYCGLSTASTMILKNIFQTLDWNKFERRAKGYLNDNRTQWSMLEKYFNGKPVDDVGMFYYAEVDQHCKKLLEKSGIIFTPGSAMGTSDSHGRFNIGQDRDTIEGAVRSILKNDRST